MPTDTVAAPVYAPSAFGATAAHLAALLESSAVAIVGTDANQTIRSWNAAAGRLFGYPAEEVIGRPALILVPGDQHAEAQGLVARARAGDPVAPYAALRLQKNGTPIAVTVTLWAVRDAAGRFLGFGAAYADRTSQRLADAETDRVREGLELQVSDRTRELATASEGRRASEDRFRLLVDAVRDYAIVMLDPAGRVVSWNAGAERITGYTADEVRGRHLGMFYLPAGGECGWAGADPADARFEDEGWRVRKDGSHFWANSVITPVRGADGQVGGYSCVTRDLTERRRGEEALRARAAEMEAANRHLAEQNAENEMFVYSVSHDLRSPLVNLQGFSKELEKAGHGLTELLADETLPPAVRSRGRALLDGKVTKPIGFIRSAVTRLSTIIDALLRLSRAGRVEYRWESVNVAEVVARVVQAAQGSIAARGATVRVGPLPPAWGDRAAVEQVFGNLIGNALTYLDPDRPGVIEVGCAAADGGRTYHVRDNGLGIDEAHRAKIFHAFQRAHPGVGGGEGLGLAIVARAVERHRGRVWVESRPGEGSTFFVTLPAPASGVVPRGAERCVTTI